jgi:FMN phosphatase YigB (HAD superfamily)
MSIATDKPIILWDIHGVLFNQKSFALAFLSYPHRYQLTTHISWQFLKDLLSAGVTNIEYLPIAEKYNNPYLQKFLLYAANDVTPITDTHQIVRELAAADYQQEIASNINPRAFAQLTNPSVFPQYAPFFALFNLPASQIAYLKDGKVIRKPDPAFFQEYLMKNNLNPQRIIFIDDNRENIKTARAMGFDAILFKHPYELRTALRARGINIAPPPYQFSHQKNSHRLFTTAPLSSK